MSTAVTIPFSLFGKIQDGDDEPVEIYTIGNQSGFSARIMTLGATLVSLNVPDDGTTTMTDVVLGFDNLSGYESESNQYFGCTVGRVCNRIAKGRFNLDGKEYHLAINNDPNHLHGGLQKSLHKRLWKASSSFDDNDRGQSITFSITSADGDEGYPGKMNVSVTYFIPADKNVIQITYSANTSQRTPINLTNHSYFNLRGEGSESAMDHTLQIYADQYTVIDESLIPTGEIADVEGTVLDFRQPTRIGDRIEIIEKTAAQGYDHNYVIRRSDINLHGQGTMCLAAVLIDSESKRRMRVMTTEPAMQFYSGNFLFGQEGKGNHVYPKRSALCFETQHYPDSVNHLEFPNTILEPSEEFHSVTAYEFDFVG